MGPLSSPGPFGHCSLRYPVLTLCLYRLLCRCRECILGSQAVSLLDHKVESKTDFPFPFGCASLSSGLSAEAKGPGREADFSIKATVPRALLMAPFFSFHPSRIRLSGDLFHDDAPDRRFSPAFRKIAMASGVLWRQSHAQQPQRLYLVCLIRQFFHSAQHYFIISAYFKTNSNSP